MSGNKKHAEVIKNKILIKVLIFPKKKSLPCIAIANVE